MMIRKALCFLVALLAIAGACADGVPSNPLEESIEWYDCYLYTEFPTYSFGNDSWISGDHDASFFMKSGIDAFSNPRALCAEVSVPLNYSDPNGEHISIFVKAYSSYSMAVEPKSVLFFLQGGTLGSSVYFESAMHEMSGLLGPTWWMITLDHRGVGRSSRLGCELTQGETPASPDGTSLTDDEFTACKDAIVKSRGTWSFLFDFSIRSSAYDVGYLIDRIKPAHGTAHIYAWSYGTLWTNQYLLLFPNQVQSVVLDGNVSPSGPKGIRTDLTTWDTDLNRVGYFFMDECKKDSFCNSKLGIHDRDTRTFVKGTFAHLDGKCSVLGWDKATLRGLLANMMFDYYGKSFIPALLYRINRCNKDDVSVLQHLSAAMSGNGEKSDCPPRGSAMTLYNIIFSEEWEYIDPPTVAELEERLETCEFASGDSVVFGKRLESSNYPLYPRNDLFNTSANVPDVHVLMLNGDMDAQTPMWYAQYLYERLTAKSKQLQIIHGAVHGTLWWSIVKNSPVTCSMQMMKSFFEDPLLVDTSCLEDLEPVDFRGSNKALAVEFFGVEDVFDGVLPSSPSCSSGSHSKDDHKTERIVLIACSTFLFVLVIVLIFVVVGMKRKLAGGYAREMYMSVNDGE
eukprot:TRINITY_DN82765_c0_g1_i1.p1 TRINITY_DN82765_c0_g1~~TRINITY_DN82765_c0_g1_i1.p1  ORF type:complete len:625 (+),score=137.88 TRINITY_DN82765_c0_g1_i1:98-1972(+)